MTATPIPMPTPMAVLVRELMPPPDWNPSLASLEPPPPEDEPPPVSLGERPDPVRVGIGPLPLVVPPPVPEVESEPGGEVG